MTADPWDWTETFSRTDRPRRPASDIDCPECGYDLFDLIPRSIDPIHLRCCRCGTETTMPNRREGSPS